MERNYLKISDINKYDGVCIYFAHKFLGKAKLSLDNIIKDRWYDRALEDIDNYQEQNIIDKNELSEYISFIKQTLNELNDLSKKYSFTDAEKKKFVFANKFVLHFLEMVKLHGNNLIFKIQ
jgi:hypothetical protein